jgi:hypothetical protein
MDEIKRVRILKRLKELKKELKSLPKPTGEQTVFICKHCHHIECHCANWRIEK